VFMAKVARTREEDVPHRLIPTIATPDLPIGCRVGLLPKRHGAVRTRARVALQQLEDVLEWELGGES